MKRNIYFFVFLTIMVLIMFSFDACIPKKFTLHGKISDVDSGAVILSYHRGTLYICDTSMIKQGEFIFKGIISEPTEANIKINGNYLVIYLESGNMNINLESQKFDELKMTGSKTEDENIKLNNILNGINERKFFLKKQLKIMDDSLQMIMEKTKLKSIKERYNMICYRVEQLVIQYDSIKLQFIQLNPSSFLSAYMLLMIERNERIVLDTLKTRFNNLDVAIRRSIPGKRIQKDISKKERNIIGADAPNFTFIDRTNQIRSLSEFAGKCVIIDVWASWCGPCREAFPHLKTLFQQYHSVGLELIAISLDRDINKWERAIKEDHLDSWQHSIIGASQIMESDFYKNYHFQGVPRLFLIGKNGKIAGNWMGSSEKNNHELEVALREIFK